MEGGTCGKEHSRHVDSVQVMDGIQSDDSRRPSIWEMSGSITLRVDRAIYPVAAAIAAGYKFTDRAFVWLESASGGTGHYNVFLRPKGAISAELLSGEFVNEILDQALRHRLEQQFAPMRTLIVAQAFAEGDLLDVVSEPDGRSTPR